MSGFFTSVKAAIETLKILLASDNGSRNIGFLQSDAGSKKTNLEDVLRQYKSVKHFGCVCNGIDDDTINFNVAIVAAQMTGIGLLIPDLMKITDEIQIAKTVYIKGQGSSRPGQSANAGVIKFDNSAVDGSGNATKCLFRFVNTFAYQLIGSAFENIYVQHVQQTPKYQHTFIFDGTFTADLQFEKIRVQDATGCIFWMKGNGSSYTPGFHNPSFRQIHGVNVGGIFGQDATAQTWGVGGEFQQINIEQAINGVSPNPILCDFSGFRVSTFDNFILEGNGQAATTTTIKNTGPMNTYKNIWIEFPTNPQPYNMDTSESVEMDGFLIPGKIKASEAWTVLTINGASAGFAYNDSRIELNRGAKVIVKRDYSQGYYSSDRPAVTETKAGRIKFENTASAAGASYSHDFSSQLFKLDRARAGFNIPSSATPLALNSIVTVEEVAAQPTKIYTSLTGQEGRVIFFEPTDANMTPNARFRVNIPADYYGSSLTVGIRYIVQAGNAGATVKGPVYQSGAASNVGQYDLDNVTAINNQAGIGGARNAYLSLGQISGSVVFDLSEITGATSAFYILVSDIQIWIGNNLPTLNGYNIDPLTWRNTSYPTTGYYIAGDVIFNTDTTSSTNGWRRKTTGSGNALGVDWIAF